MKIKYRKIQIRPDQLSYIERQYLRESKVIDAIKARRIRMVGEGLKYSKDFIFKHKDKFIKSKKGLG